MYEVQFARRALKQLRRLPADIQARAIQTAETLAEDPRAVGQRMKGEWAEFWRARLGRTHRIVYVIHDGDKLVEVTWVGTRQDAPYD